MVANVFHQGFFRSWYDDETYEQILNQMQEDHSVRWKFSITMSNVLKLTINLPESTNQLLWWVIKIFSGISCGKSRANNWRRFQSSQVNTFVRRLFKHECHKNVIVLYPSTSYFTSNNTRCKWRRKLQVYENVKLAIIHYLSPLNLSSRRWIYFAFDLFDKWNPSVQFFKYFAGQIYEGWDNKTILHCTNQ